MCFSSPSVPAPATPAAAAPAPSPTAVNQDPTSVRQNQDVAAYGAGGSPNLRRADPSLNPSSTGVGTGTPAGGGGLAAM